MTADRRVWVYQARQALNEFAARGIDLPKPVLDAVNVMNRVEAAKPAQPSPTAIRQAIGAGADQTELDRLLLADATYTRLASEWTQAHTDTAGAVLAAIRDAEPTLLPALRRQADGLIAKLAQVAALGGVRLEHLVRAGRQSDATLLAERDTVAAELSALYELRDTFLVRGGGKALTINGVRCAVWKDPDAAAAHARGKTIADQYVSGLAAGCQLWFPSPAEAIAAATAIADQRAADAQRKRQQEHGIGSTVFFG
jgi:hypothetical protein